MTQTEIPEKLKALYRHWNLHTDSVERLPLTLAITNVFQDKQLLEEIKWFTKERINIWKKKELGQPRPFTEDEILSTFCFCNIFREFDKQTIEFHTLLNPLREDFPLWLLNMFYCRMVARTETIKHTGLLSFDPQENEIVYEKLMNSSRPRFGTPYVFPVSVIMQSQTPTRELFICLYLPEIMKFVAEEVQTWHKKSVYDGVSLVLSKFKYELRFHWTEVLIDTAYQFPKLIDLFGRFPTGPGALPTLSRISPDADPSLLVTDLSRSYFDTGLTFEKHPLILSSENWEGIACEFRKYTNLKAGTGRRRLYKE